MTTSFPPLDWANDPAETLRQVYRAERAVVLEDIPDDVRITPITKPGLDGLRFTPNEMKEGPTLLYFHGGGWIVGSPETHQTLCAWLSKLTGLPLISVRYRLAPEHPFPAQAEDAAAALAAIDGPVILAGDSAGAAMAFWAEAGAPGADVRAVIGFYGAFGLTESASIHRLSPQTPGLHQSDIVALYNRLGFHDPSSMVQHFSASTTPICLVQAGQDPLADDTTHLAGWADEIGRPITLFTAEHAAHGFLHFVGRDAVAREMMGQVAEWISSLDLK